MSHFFDHLQKLKRYGVEYVSNRYYATAYQGSFDDLKDPQAQGRAKICSKLVVNRDEALALWAYPVSPYAGQDKGLVMPPDEGDVAWVWFDHGDTGQPHYLGSWWCNPDTSTEPKSPDKSFLPAEFRPEKDKAPTKRGFKSKAGHGWLTEDDEELGKLFRIWTGSQEEVGKEAVKHHELIFNDKDEFVLVTSFGKENGDDPRFQHQLRFDDKDEFVILHTAGTAADERHRLVMHDKDGYILLETHDKHFVALDENTPSIQVSTAGEFQTTWDEGGKVIETSTPGGQKLTMDDNAASNVLVTAGMQEIKQEQAGTTINDPIGKFDVIATLASTHAYAANLTRTVGGLLTDTITGAAVLAFNQALTITVGQAAAWTGQVFSWTGTTFTWLGTVFSMAGTQVSITAPQVTIASGNVLAGSGVNLPLLNALALAKYNAHIHVVVGPFPGVTLVTPAQMIPAVDTTIALLGA